MLRTFFIFIALFFVSLPTKAEVTPPYFRLKMGYYLTQVTAGNTIQDQPLGTMITLQPTLLWDFNSLSSRVGIHYLGDFNSEFGLIPISGIGISGYFYPYGITSANESTVSNITIQKYKMGPYFFGGITPVNFNYNKSDELIPQDNISFSALIVELMLGIGYDYPLRPNSMISLSLNYRFGSVDQNTDVGNVDYSGLGMNLSFTTSYF